MRPEREMAFGWVISWFVIFSPFYYYFAHSIIWSLMHGIVGVGLAIAFLTGWFSK